MIEIDVARDDDLDLWARLKSEVVPNEPVTADQLRATDEPDRLLLLARSGGEPVGCGIAARSSFGGRAFVAARVLASFRRRGIGSALVRTLSDHARALGLTGVNAFVYADEPHSVAFAEHFGLAEADYQLEQIRAIGPEEAPASHDGVELVALDGRRDELLLYIGFGMGCTRPLLAINSWRKSGSAFMRTRSFRKHRRPERIRR